MTVPESFADLPLADATDGPAETCAGAGERTGAAGAAVDGTAPPGAQRRGWLDAPVVPGSSTEPGSVPADGDAAKGGDGWLSPEGLEIKPVYTAKDLEGLDALDTYTGLPPFL